MARRVIVGVIGAATLLLVFALAGCDNPLLDTVKNRVNEFSAEDGGLTAADRASIRVTSGGSEVVSESTISYGTVGTARSLELTFEIENTGDVDVVLDGSVGFRNETAPGVFAVVTHPPSTLEPGARAEFTLRYAPHEPGDFSAEVAVPYATDDAIEYVFTVTGTAAFRGINVIDDIGSLDQYAAGMGDMVVIGDTIVVCYHDSGNLELASSTDGGYSWTTQSPTFGAGADHECSLALAGDYLYLAYRGSDDYLHVARSPDLGVSWDSATVYDTRPTAGSISIAAHESVVTIAFSANSKGWLVRSTDAGANWGSAIEINSVGDTGTPNDLVATDGQVVMTFYNQSQSGVIYYRYGPYGPTGDYTENTKNDSGMTGVGIAQYGSHVYGVFAGEYEPGGAPDFAVFLQYSVDGGANWLAAPIAVEYVGRDSMFPSVATNGAYVYVCYFDNVNKRLSFERSDDHGATWAPETEVTKTIDDSQPMSGYYNVVRAHGDDVYVMYFDDDELRFAKSIDNGVSW